MSDNKPGQEPSMEDILASIRRILSEDEAEEQAKAEGGAPPPPPAPEPEPEPVEDLPPIVMPEPEPEPMFEPEPEPEPMFEPEPEPEPEPMFEPEPEPLMAFEPEDDVLELTDDMLLDTPKPAFDAEDLAAITAELEDEPPPPIRHRAAPLPPIEDPYMAEDRSRDGSNAFGQLIKAVVRDRAILLGQGGLTLEELVREILRPILKDWLDENLPYMIERIVKQEIEKMVNRVDNFD